MEIKYINDIQIIVEYANGNKFWYINGKNGPAIEFTNSDRGWYLNNKLHREDGPAIEFTNGYKEWWLNGKRLSEKDFNLITMASLPKDLFKI